MKKYLSVLVLCAITTIAMAQKVKVGIDSTQNDENMTFSGTRVVQDDSDYDSTGTLTLGGYISTYYAYYNDRAAVNAYHKFPTIAPKSDAFSLNIAQISARYTSNKFRGNLTLHWGDIPSSAWSKELNLIQEANVGFRLKENLWFDAGFFRTHIGLESIQPRENIATSLALTTYFEPYYMSGAKLTWKASPKFAIQANVFNGFNGFSETNKDKAVGLSAVYEPNSNLSITLNTITCDESPDSVKTSHQRLYNNAYMVYRSRKIDIGAEYNFGFQQNTQLMDSTATAFIHSALLAAKYKVTKQFSIHARGEYFYDPDEILTGPVYNSFHNLVGINSLGATLGVEYKFIPNSYIRCEGRTLHTTEDETIFVVNGKFVNHREEIICSVGLWF